MLSDRSFFGDQLPETRTDQLPVVRRFYSQEPPLHTKFETQFYDMLGEAILGKLPALADQMNSRDGRGDGLNEAKRAAVVAECDRTISDATAKLAELKA